MAQNRGLTVKTLQAPFQGARFTPTIFSIIAVGMLVVGLPVMAATASNIGGSINVDVNDSIAGRESEGAINPHPFHPLPSTGLDLVNNPYTISGPPPITYANSYTVGGAALTHSYDRPNGINTLTTHTVDYDPSGPLTSCIPDSLTSYPTFYGGEGFPPISFQEIAYNISTGDEIEQNDFRVGRSLLVTANKDPASPYSNCNSHDWDWNLQIPHRMFNTSKLVTELRFDLINDASSFGTTWGGSDYCIAGANDAFTVSLVMNGTTIQTNEFKDFCGVVKIYNTSFDESDPVAAASAYRHTNGGEFVMDLQPSTAFDLREFMDEHDFMNYTISLKVTNCGLTCPFSFVTTSTTPELQPIFINYYVITAEPDAYSTFIKGSALTIGIVFLVLTIGATPLWNPLVKNVKGANF